MRDSSNRISHVAAILVLVMLSVSTSAAEETDPSARVQVLVPGFEVVELPIRLPNLNNLRYRANGSLYALGYNGNVWILTDTDRDGLEDSSRIFFENTNQLRGPIGMAVIPDGHPLLQRDGAVVPEARGVVVASKGKVSALIDFDGDDVAETERVIASGWKEIPPNVDTIGVAIHPTDGSIFFGLGTAEYDNAYLIDEQGHSNWSLASERGTVQRIKPDLSGRETVCTGVRFTIGLQFDEHGELFATDQEGATWLANGNPFDELLHIRHGLHYGFPPRHPRHLPKVFDEPSVFDYRPQHQSACGLAFNIPHSPATKTFGPDDWLGDAFVTGESRGKLYRTKLIRTGTGDYLAVNQILACLSMLAVDCTVTPSGNLLIGCHSGGPDWGTGPNGEGKIFLIRSRPSEAPRPVMAWCSGQNECRILFDRPLKPEGLKGIAERISLTAGPYVSAGDRLEVIRPGYEVVQLQERSPRKAIAVYSASVTADHRTLVLSTAVQTEAVQYAVRLPGMERQLETTMVGALPQENQIDLDYSLSGVWAQWTPSSVDRDISDAAVRHDAVILPYLDFDVVRAMRLNEPQAEVFLTQIGKQGTLQLATRVATNGLFLPTTQPGSSLDFSILDDQWITQRRLRLRCSHPMSGRFRGHKVESSIRGVENTIELDLSNLDDELPLLELTMTTGDRPLTLHVDWLARFQDGSERSGAMPIQRLLVPWATRVSTLVETPQAREILQLAHANWGRGRQVFRSQQAMCHRCHTVHGEGGQVGPNLSNLIHRDYDSVARDIRHPSYAINPDFISYTVETKSGQVFTGVLQGDGPTLTINDSAGNATKLASDDVAHIQASPVSVMPADLAAKITDEQFRDLVAFLLLPPPHMPRDLTEPGAPPRSRRDMEALLAGAGETVLPQKQLHLLLVAGPQDHGPGEHDYPAWQRVWSQLLAAADHVTVDTAMDWPTGEQLKVADTIVLYQKGTWNENRAQAIDAHLAKGRGLVLIHWAVEGEGMASAFAQRIGFASDLNRTQYRHGPLQVNWQSETGHPIARNLSRISLVDESYWNLVAGSTGKLELLAKGGPEAGDIRPPLFWTVQPLNGRVFVSIPGHYSWTFDDPVFRTILLRGIAWASHEAVDRFNELVTLGVSPEPNQY